MKNVQMLAVLHEELKMKTERTMKTEWLSRGKDLRLRLIGLQAERMERLSRADYGGISSGSVQSCSNRNGMESKYLALVETETELKIVRTELDKVEAEIRDAIAAVKNPLYQTFLRMRFLAYKTERQIAKETGYSFNYIDNHVRKKSIDAIKMVGNDG